MTPTRSPQQVSIDARAARMAWENGKSIEVSDDMVTWTDPREVTPERLDDPKLFWRPKPMKWLVYGLEAPDWVTHAAVDSVGEVVFCSGPMHLNHFGCWIRYHDQSMHLKTGKLCHGVQWGSSLLTRP